jgi:adenylate kinase family enzyme
VNVDAVPAGQSTQRMRRIAVIGCIGAGKSTLARRIGNACRLPVVHLDQLWWQDGSYRITGYQTVAAHTMAGPAFRDLQQELAAADTWVIDGGYIPDLDTRLTRADTVVFLDLPRRVCLWRLLRRHNRRRPDYPGGVREGVGWLFILARWILRYPSQKRPAIEFAIAGHCPADTTVIRLRSRRQVTDFLRTIERDKPDSR